MFKWIKGQSGSKPGTSAESNLEQAASQGCRPGQLARALLMKAAKDNAQSREFLIRLDKDWPIIDSNTLEAEIEGAMAVVALTIVKDAMRESLGEKEYCDLRTSKAGDPLPTYVHLLVAFAFAIVAIMARKLRAEDSSTTLDSKQPCVGVVGGLFLFRSTAEKVQIFTIGTNAFSSVTKSGASNVLEWFNALDKLVILYLIDSESLNARQFPSMFGQMLKSLLSAAN